ncbi:MAG: formyltransferase family protein [Bacteroidota bacterium]
MRIIVLTDHPFALASLQALVEKDILEGIVTASSNKDLLIQLNQLCDKVGIPLLQVHPKKMEQQLGIFLRKQKATAVFVFGFSHKISTKLLQIPRWGFINFHPSQLPQFRGPNPDFWQIKSQVEQGGITAHKMDKDWDKGEIIGVLPISISAEMTTSHYLSEAGFYTIQLMNMVVSALQIGQLPGQKQEESKASYQKNPSKSDLRIDWMEQSVEEIRALVNACNSALGGAITFIRNNPLQILQVAIMEEESEQEVGVIISINPLLVACRDRKILKIEIVQIAEGIITGERFAELAEVKMGEFFS